jgi:hypothetical protein
MQAHTERWREVEISNAQIGHLLHPGAGVIEKQQERAIAERVGPVHRQGGKEGVDLVALEKPGLRGRDAFHRDGGHALGDLQHLGHAPGEVVEKGVEAREALIPRSDVIPALVFQVADEEARP